MAIAQRQYRGTSMFHDTDTDVDTSRAYLTDDQLAADPRGRRIVEIENTLVRHYLDALPAGAGVLDAPCGNGRMSQFVAQRNDLKLCAVDFNPNMLEALKSRNVEAITARRVRSDILALPLPDRSVDLVLNIRLMHHIADRDTQVAMYRELARVCRGRIITTYWSTHCWRYLRKRILGKKIKSYPVSPSHYRSVLAGAGLTLEREQPVQRWVEYLHLVVCQPGV